MIHRSFISPNEIYKGRVVTYAEVAAIAATLNQAEALHFIGFLNLLLSSATTESKLNGVVEPVRDVQTMVFREVVSEQLLADLKAQLRDASLLDRPILHRAQLLFALRLVATHGLVDGGNRLQERRDFDAVGDLLFLINGLFAINSFPKDADAVALQVAANAGALYELENPPPIELTLPRIQDLLIDRLPQTSDDPAELERLERIAVFMTGLSTRAWLDLRFMLYSFWAATTFRDLMKERGRGYLDPNKRHEIISKQMLDSAVEGMGIRFQDVPNYLKIDQFSNSALFDLTLFRSKPLWIMPDGLVLCIDIGMLTELLGAHVFFTMMNALDTPERRNRFGGAWGDAFEGYVLDALANVFGSKKWIFHRNPPDEAIKEELWDGLALRDTSALVIEVKGTFVKTAAKYSGVPWRFGRGLLEKFGMATRGGSFQLTRGISNVWFARTAETKLFDRDKVTDVFPILVVQDPMLELGIVARVISDSFAKAIKREQRKAAGKTPKIWPLTIITADDLDRLSAAVEATKVPLDSVLKRFHRVFPSRARSLNELLDAKHGHDFGFPEQVRKIIGERFKSRMQGVMERFKSGEYGGGDDVGDAP